MLDRSSEGDRYVETVGLFWGNLRVDRIGKLTFPYKSMSEGECVVFANVRACR